MADNVGSLSDFRQIWTISRVRAQSAIVPISVENKMSNNCSRRIATADKYQCVQKRLPNRHV